MSRIVHALAAALIAVVPAAPAMAGASGFLLNNGTAAEISELSIRRAGTADWRSLGAAPAPGSAGPIKFNDPDCAFDIRATVSGAGPTTWAGVNLCDVKGVTLKRDPSSGAWVDYDD